MTASVSRPRSYRWWPFVPLILLPLLGCSRMSWGPNGPSIGVGRAAPARPPFDVDEALVLRLKDRPPEVAEGSALKEFFSSAVKDEVLPISGNRTVAAWLLINQDGRVREVRFELTSGSSAFDDVFRKGILLTFFRPAERRQEGMGEARLVSVWMEFTFSISWSGRNPPQGNLIDARGPLR